MTVDLGTDISTPDASDLDPMFRLVSGTRGLAEALARRLVTPRGTLLDDPAYGYDLRSRLNDNLTPGDLAQLAVDVRAELARDERVEDAAVTVTFANSTLRVAAVVATAAGPFRLVLAVSSVTAEVLAAEALST